MRARGELEGSVLYSVLREHLTTLLARADEGCGSGLPRFVQRELRRYLDRGILAYGFARVRCLRCGRDELVAFSFKGRGFCPSCCARRMACPAAHLCDDVLPHVPIRKWVLSLPFRIRYLLAYDAKLCAAVRRVLVRTILDWHRERGESANTPAGRSCAVVIAQRFGGAISHNPHLHALVIDGIYSSKSPLALPDFHEAAPFTDLDVVLVATVLHRRILRYLRRLGRIPRAEHDHSSQPEPADPLYAQICVGTSSGFPSGRWAPSSLLPSGAV